MAKIKYDSPWELFGGERVQVYWNFPKACWSIQSVGTNHRVLCHASVVYLRDCSPYVSEAGRQRVLREKRKNVHAKIRGVLSEPVVTNHYVYLGRVQYNPYRDETFMLIQARSPAEHEAPTVPFTGCDLMELRDRSCSAYSRGQ